MASVGVGLFGGFFIGRIFTLNNEPKRLKKDRETTLTAILAVMSSTARLNEDVDSHNAALQSAQKELETIESDVKFEDLKTALMSNISRVVQSNRKLKMTWSCPDSNSKIKPRSWIVHELKREPMRFAKLETVNPWTKRCDSWFRVTKRNRLHLA